MDVPLEVLSRLTHEGLAFVGDDGRIVVWNEAAASLCGIDAKRALGALLSDLFVTPDAALLSLGDHEPQQVRLVTRDDPDRSIGIASVRLAKGWLISFGPQRQFTAIEQMKSEIVAAVSHELKTPIATIKAYATTLRENPERVAHERDEYLHTIEQQADRLTHAVDDLLVAARVDVAHLLKRRVSIGLGTFFSEIIASFAKDDAERIRCSANDLVITGDPELLREAFTHLLDNAVKFSSRASVVRVDASLEGIVATISVRDEGIGIAEDHLPYIFERFYRVESDLAAARSGSGLGLYVARAVVRAHGGTITVESSPGRGSAFVVTLPVRI